MKTTSVSGKEERRILTAMIVDTNFLSQFVPRIKTNPVDCFASKWSNLVAGWCVSFYERYQTAPEHHIQRRFERWAAKHKDKETVKLVESFISTLSDDYATLKKRSNTQHTLDIAGEYLNEVRCTRTAEDVLAAVQAGDLAGAMARIAKHEEISMAQGDGIDVLTSPECMKAAFEEQSEPLIKFDEPELAALKTFFKGAFEPGGFIAILAPEKRGKTWWLIFLALRAVQQGVPIGFFSVGDMTQNQMLRRLAIALSKHPKKAKLVRVPNSIGINEGGGEQYGDEVDKKDKLKVDVGYDDHNFESGITHEIACKHLARWQKRTRGSELFRLSTHPNSTLSVRDMEGILKRWEKSGFVPQIVFVDYMDILRMPDGGDETRNQVNATWKAGRALTQKLNVLLVTATQADAQGAEAELLGRSNFSEDKRKFAHVTGMFGINQTDAEKKAQVQRLNWIVLREDEFTTTDCCHVAGCLDIGNPAIVAAL